MRRVFITSSIIGILLIGVHSANAFSLFDWIQSLYQQVSEEALGAVSVLRPIQGGTGISTTTASAGDCFVIDSISSNIPVYGFSGCGGAGTVDGGGGTNQITYWTDLNSLAATSTPTSAAFFATSTSVASKFPIASTTSFSVANLINVAGLGTST